MNRRDLLSSATAAGAASLITAAVPGASEAGAPSTGDFSSFKGLLLKDVQGAAFKFPWGSSKWPWRGSSRFSGNILVKDFRFSWKLLADGVIGGAIATGSPWQGNGQPRGDWHGGQSTQIPYQPFNGVPADLEDSGGWERRSGEGRGGDGGDWHQGGQCGTLVLDLGRIPVYDTYHGRWIVDPEPVRLDEVKLAGGGWQGGSSLKAPDWSGGGGGDYHDPAQLLLFLLCLLSQLLGSYQPDQGKVYEIVRAIDELLAKYLFIAY